MWKWFIFHLISQTSIRCPAIMLDYWLFRFVAILSAVSFTIRFGTSKTIFRLTSFIFFCFFKKSSVISSAHKKQNLSISNSGTSDRNVRTCELLPLRYLLAGVFVRFGTHRDPKYMFHHLKIPLFRPFFFTELLKCLNTSLFHLHHISFQILFTNTTILNGSYDSLMKRKL